jgi:hypothetical protein
MDQVTYARRRAQANQRLTVSLQRLEARFELPPNYATVIPPVPGADVMVRQLLELEDMAGKLELLSTAPIREDANDRLAQAPTFTPLPTQAEMTAGIKASAPHAQEVPTMGFGFEDNPGPPVLHAHGKSNIDIHGTDAATDPRMATTLTTASGEAAHARADELSQQAQLEPLVLDDSGKHGFVDNSGPPVVATPNAARSEENLRQAMRDTDRRGEEARKDEEERLKELSTQGFPDNEGPPVVNPVPTLERPSAEQIKTLQAQIEIGRQAAERIDELSETMRDAEQKRLNQQPAEDPSEVVPPGVEASHLSDGEEESTSTPKATPRSRQSGGNGKK